MFIIQLELPRSRSTPINSRQNVSNSPFKKNNKKLHLNTKLSKANNYTIFHFLINGFTKYSITFYKLFYKLSYRKLENHVLKFFFIVLYSIYCRYETAENSMKKTKEEKETFFFEILSLKIIKE